MSDPCRCHNNHAMVTAFHAGHCCFFPASQTCHPEEVASWETEEAERRKLLADNERNETP